MRAIEFKSIIKDNQIAIPAKLQSELPSKSDKDVRVIVLIEDSETTEEFIFRQAATRQFLDGYADSDSIYDN